MSHHIEPCSVKSYLSGICQQLETHFPNVRPACHSPLVKCTLEGCLCLKSSPTKRKCIFTFDDLKKVTTDLESSIQHNNLLFLSMLVTGFFALMHLCKLSFPNDQKMRNWKKISKRLSVILSDDQYGFHLPCHKADQYFEGNHIIVKSK